MNKEQIARLKELAEKATPGKWKNPGRQYIVSDIDPSEPIICDVIGNNFRFDIAYIAAANPQVILELIAENERLERQVNWLAMSCQSVRKYPTLNGRPEDDWTAHKWRKAARKAAEEECKTK